jgi:exodeoxyribonuclease V alpha subunit
MPQSSKLKCSAICHRYKDLLQKLPQDQYVRIALETTNAKWIQSVLVKKCKIGLQEIMKLLNHIRLTGRTDLCFHRITEYPFHFVSLHDKVIRFDDAKRIANQFPFVSTDGWHEAWIYDRLVFVNNRLFLSSKILAREFHAQFANDSSVDLKDIVRFVEFDGFLYTTLPSLLAVETQIQENIFKINRRIYSKEKKLNLHEFSEQKQIQFTTVQLEAITHTLQCPLTIVCGHPGTGKTTIIDCVLHKTEHIVNVLVIAPTGMAVNNAMSRCSQYKHATFTTIHKQMFAEPKDNYQLIIVDEFSMVDIFMCKYIVEMCVQHDAALLLLADLNQLPPIGPGNPLEALANKFQVFYLNKIMRQSDGNLKSAITNMSQRKAVLLKHFDDKSLIFEAHDTIDERLMRDIVNYYGVDMHNDRFVTAQHAHNGGTVEMNKILQKIFLKKNAREIKPSFTTKTPMYEGDWVVRIVNDYKEDTLFANGDVGVVKYGDTMGECLVKYNEHQQESIFLDELYTDYALAYCLTVHKVQGSQYDTIVVVISQDHLYSWKENDARHLLYTAISRAKKRCIVVGSKELFKYAQRVQRTPKKSTLFNTNYQFKET